MVQGVKTIDFRALISGPFREQALREGYGDGLADRLREMGHV